MADEDIGYFDTPTAEEILRAVQWLQRSGIMTRKGQKPQFNPPPVPPILVKNISGEEIPRFACVQATGTFMQDDQCYLQVNKPTDITGKAGPFFINMFEPIPATATPNLNEYPFGTVTDGPHCNALVKTSVSAGTYLCPEVDEWKLQEGGNHFVMIGINSGDHLGANVNRVKFIGGAPLRVVGKVPNGLGGTCAEATVNSLKGVNGSAAHLGSSITAFNVHSFEADAGAIARAEYVIEECRWEIYQVTCPDSPICDLVSC